jgi:F-type H+-transporting ATPase subunit epsilon
MDTMQFDLITPEATFFSGQAKQIDIPGTEGDMGVLPGHMNLISSVRMGIVKVYADKDTIKRVFVAGGMLAVKAESCTILTEQAKDLDTISRPDAEKLLSDARNALENALDETAKIEAIRGVAQAEALISALS